MMTVHEVSRLTGMSIRALRYYDRIGLLSPSRRSEAGYRLYDDHALERLQQILLFRELEFPLKDIREMLDSPSFDHGKALEQQIRLLTLKKEHIENLIELAQGLRVMGVKHIMDFEAFDTSKLDQYMAEAKASWGQTSAYREFEEKHKGRTQADEQALGQQMMDIFYRFGEIRQGDSSSEKAQSLVKELQAFITEHFYTCTDDILRQLGLIYAGGGEMSANIDRHGGEGTAEFAYQAIRQYCEKTTI